MLTFARRNNPAPNVSYTLGDAQTIGDNPHYQERFNKAVSFFVLHWCPDHAKALRSILACLKPGGEALFIVVKSDVLIAEADKFLRRHVKWGDYVQTATVYELLRVCSNVKFLCPRISNLNGNFLHIRLGTAEITVHREKK